MEITLKNYVVGKWNISAIESDEYIGPWLANGNEWENWMRQDINFTYKKGTDILDIGGNIGCNALMFSDYGPVHTFEPLFHKIIQENLNKNKTNHPVIVHEYGLSNIATTAPIYLPKNRNGLYNYGCCSLKPDFDDGHSNVCVNIILQKLDDVYNGVPSVMKIDVEGNELEVLQGAIETIKKHKPALIVEIHKLETSLIPDFLKQYGYETIITRHHANYLFLQ
jgi:FkbM family methyltransferase